MLDWENKKEEVMMKAIVYKLFNGDNRLCLQELLKSDNNLIQPAANADNDHWTWFIPMYLMLIRTVLLENSAMQELKLSELLPEISGLRVCCQIMMKMLSNYADDNKSFSQVEIDENLSLSENNNDDLSKAKKNNNKRQLPMDEDQRTNNNDQNPKNKKNTYFR